MKERRIDEKRRAGMSKSRRKPTGIISTKLDMTERKRMEEEVSGLARFPSENPNPVLRLGKDGTIITANPASKLLLKEWGSEIGQLAPRIWRDMATAALTTRKNKNIDVDLGRKAYTFLFKPIAGAGYVNLYGRDTTDRKRMEETLRESEEKYRAIVENSPELVGILQDGILKYVNRTATEKLGWTYEELLSPSFDPIEKVVAKEFRGSIRENASKRLRGEDTPPYEITLTTRTGSAIPVIVRAARIVYRERPAVEFIFSDITELKKSQDELQRHREELQTIFDSVPAMIFQLDREHRLVRVNRAYAESVGLPKDELEGRSTLELFPHQAEGYWRDDDEVIKSGRPKMDITESFETAKGTRWAMTDKLPYRDQNGNVTGLLAFALDITEHKQAADTLMEDEKRFRHISTTISDIAYSCMKTPDDNYSLDWMIGATERITGYSIEEIKAQSCWRFLVVDEDLPIFERWVTGLAPGSTGSCELRLREKNGGTVWVDSVAECVKDPVNPQILHVYGGLVDITERKHAEEKLRESEQLYRTLAESSPDDVFIVKRDTSVGYMNRSGLQHFGLTLEAIAGKKASELFPSEVAKRVSVPVSTVFQTGKPVHAEAEVSFLGVVSWRDEHWIPLKTGSETTAVLGIARDMTERKRMEQELKHYSEHLEQMVKERTEELRSARERLDYLIKANPAVIYSAKPLPDLSDFAMMYLSERVVEMLGYAPEEFIGHLDFWGSHVHPEDLQPTLAAVQRLWREGQNVFEYRFLHKDGSYRWIHEEAKVDRDVDDKPTEVYGYWTDITERKKLEAYLTDAQRLIAIGQTAAMVGHDLRNPLQAIATTVDLLRKQSGSTPTGEKKLETKLGESDMLETIQDSVRYMDKIVSDLQSYAEPRILKLTQVNLSQLLNESILMAQVPSNIKVSVGVRENYVLADPVMQRVFVNLLLNAIQAMPNGGELTVSTERQGKHVLIHFQDTGVGIPEENLPKVFDPLFTTKAKGQGLGLAVCKRLVDAHEGSISVESTVNKGSTFTVRLLLQR